MKRDSLAQRHCSIARAGAELGDGWTLVILREVLLRNRRFDGLQEQTGMSPRSLTLRLKAMVDDGILERVAYSETPKRYEYCLTEKGLDLWPVLIVLKQWGDKWCGPWAEDTIPMGLTHAAHGHELSVQLSCAECGEPVTPFDVETHLSAPMVAEREAMADAHARRLKKAKSA